MVPVPFDKLSGREQLETSAQIRERVTRARAIQQERFADYQGVHCNAQMNTRLIRKHCILDDECQKMIKTAMEKIGLSARAYDRILKVSRTIADLASSEKVETMHIAEAIGYRNLDRGDWAERGL